jgi:hypothetical protein
MKLLFLSLAIVPVALLVAGCPQSKVPDTPPMVPQPKAAQVSSPLLTAPWQLSRIVAP